MSSCCSTRTLELPDGGIATEWFAILLFAIDSNDNDNALLLSSFFFLEAAAIQVFSVGLWGSRLVVSRIC